MKFNAPLNEEKAVIYVRVSTEKQAKEGHGMEGQEEECMNLIKFKKWKFLRTYKDKAISGTKENHEREGMPEMLEDAKNHKFDIIVIYKLDRLGRTATNVVQTVKHIIDDLGLRLVSCSEDIDTSKPSGRLVLNMFASIAEYEKDIIVQRLTMGREHVRKTRGETGGLLNYGYVRDEGKKITVINEKAEIVRKIIYEYEDGKSMEKLTRELNEMDISSPKGGVWHSSAVRKILSNRENYEGAVRAGKNLKNEKWPIIYKDNFEKTYISPPEYIKQIVEKTHRVAVYIRICNASNNNYMNIQEEKIRKYVKEKALFITKFYYEVAPSYDLNNRDGLENLLKDGKANKYKILVIYRINILGHNDEIVEPIKNILDGNNIGIISILESN